MKFSNLPVSPSPRVLDFLGASPYLWVASQLQHLMKLGFWSLFPRLARLTGNLVRSYYRRGA
jgi:hypothetical protein